MWALCSCPFNLCTFPDHRNRIKDLHEKCDISISKVTHGGRTFAAMTARSHGASTDGTKALGGWHEQGSFRACYDRALPVDALLASAMFNGRKPETYFLARDRLGMFSPLLRLYNVRSDTPITFQSHQQTYCTQFFHGSRISKRHWFLVSNWAEKTVLITHYTTSSGFLCGYVVC